MKHIDIAWRESSHSGVHCAECHNEPGLKGFIKGNVIGPVRESYLFATKQFGKKPIVLHMDDDSCMRPECHKPKRLRRKTFYRDSLHYQDSIAFHHRGHVPLKGMRSGVGHSVVPKCSSCHRHQGTASAACFLCHFNKAAYDMPLSKDCGECHTSQLKIPEEHLDKHRKVDVAGMKCGECHKSVKAKADAWRKCGVCHGADTAQLKKPPPELHRLHKHVRCLECHQGISHPAGTVEFRHSPKWAKKNCGDCHVVQQKAYTSKFGFGLEIDPNPHAEPDEGDPAKCVDCHQGLFDGTHSIKKIRLQCGKCHKDRSYESEKYFELLVTKSLRELKKRLKKVEGKLDDLEAEQRQSYEQALGMANLVEKDGSGGVHNLCMDEVVDAANEKLDEIEEESEE